MLSLLKVTLVCVALLAGSAFAQEPRQALLPIYCGQTDSFLQTMEKMGKSPIVIAQRGSEDDPILVSVWYNDQEKDMVVSHSFKNGTTCLVTGGEEARYIIPGEKL